MVAHSAGTLFVLRSGGFVGWSIRLMTRSRVNHAGVCTGDGSTVEAEAAGAVRKQERPPSQDIIYGDPLLRRVEATAPGRGVHIGREAAHVLHTPYGFPDLVALAWAAFKNDPTEPPAKPNWWQKRVMRDDRLICSQLADLVYLRAGVHLFTDGRLPGQVTPGDLEQVVANPDWPITIDPK